MKDISLFGHGPHHHPIIQQDREFARQKTKLEIDAGRLEFTFASFDDRINLQLASTKKIARDFWTKLGRIFPSIIIVVLAGCLPRRSLPPPHGEVDIDYAIIEHAVRCAPTHIKVQVAFDDGSVRTPHNYTLWQLSNEIQPLWRVIDISWSPTRILLPPRKWSDSRHSPLDDLVTFMKRNYTLHLEGRGMDWLKMETYARYAQNGVIRCPRLNCDATFRERSEWKHHLDAVEHWRLGPGHACIDDPVMELLVFRGTPREVQDTLEARQRRIDEAYRQTKDLQRRVGCGWSEEGTEARRLFEEHFCTQLREENFAAPGQLNESQCPWIGHLHSHSNPTHIYYSGE